MPLERAFTALSLSERQLLRSRYIQSGQCVRCFHSSIRQRAGENTSGEGNDQGTPYNAPKRGPSRKERSAKISNEISMLQRGPPPTGSEVENMKGPGSVTGTFHTPPAAPTTSAGFMEHPEDIGGATGRMGENVSLGREGPNAQGAGRPLRYEDRRADATQDSTSSVRGARAGQGVEEPAEGGASVLGTSQAAPRSRTGLSAKWFERVQRLKRKDGKAMYGSAKSFDALASTFGEQATAKLFFKMEGRSVLDGLRGAASHRRNPDIQEPGQRRIGDELWQFRERNGDSELVKPEFNAAPKLMLNSTYEGENRKLFSETVHALLPYAQQKALKKIEDAAAAEMAEQVKRREERKERRIITPKGTATHRAKWEKEWERRIRTKGYGRARRLQHSYENWQMRFEKYLEHAKARQAAAKEARQAAAKAEA